MKKILLALEQGNNYGHAAIASVLASMLMARGHEVVVAGPAHELAAAVFKDVPYRLVQAPLCRLPVAPRPVFPWASLATVLWDLGLGQPQRTQPLFDAWRAIYDEVKPDAIVFNAAPFAMLAAIGRGVTRIQIGHPYDAPPPVSPIPSFQFWTRVPKTQAQAFEAKFQAVLVQALGIEDRYACLGELIRPDHSLLISVPELDPYGNEGRHYVGPIPPPRGGTPVAWRAPHSRKALAYLRAEHTHVPLIAQTLAGLYDEVVITCPDVPDAALARFKGSHVQLFREFINVGGLLAQSHLIVTHAGGFLTQGVVHGIAQVALPTQYEQLTRSRLLATAGLGIMALPRNPRACVDAIRIATNTPLLTARVAEAGRRHADLAARPGERIMEAFDRVL